MRDNIIFRLVVYYVAIVVFLGGVTRVFPEITRYVNLERARVAASADSPVEEAAASPPGDRPGADDTLVLLTPERLVPVVVALITAFLVTLPVTWVYRWTRPKKRYSQAFTHTLLVVPIGIALVVFLVKGSLALAFSLAGIVAAVRFRTSLEEPIDAVYMFIVIGAGLAAGVQLLAIAFVASVIFNAVALGVWKSNFGAEPALVSGWRIVSPGAAVPSLDAGDGARPDAEASPKQRRDPFDVRLRIQTTHAEVAQRATAPILNHRAKSWRVERVTPIEDGSSAVEFDVRLKKSTDLVAFCHEIEEVEPAHIRKVELKPRKRSKV